MRVKKRRTEHLIYSVFFLATMFLSGCVNHLEKGWEHFQKGAYLQARAEWIQEKEPPQTELVAKAKAAENIVEYNAKITAAKTAGNHEVVVENAMLLLAEDQWENKDWLQKSPPLQEYLDNAHLAIEEAYFLILSDKQKQEQWEQITGSYPKYSEYCAKFGKQPSVRIAAVLKVAEETIERIRLARLAAKKAEEERLAAIAAQKAAEAAAKAAAKAKILRSFDIKLKCGKDKFLDEDYAAAMNCINEAKTIAAQHPQLKFNLDDLEYVMQSIKQGIAIQEEIELERKRAEEAERKRIAAMAEERRIAAEAEKKRIEEEQKREAERQLREEEERRRIEAEKIRLAKAAEKKRLRELEEKRRIEAERKRKLEERNRRWRAFLKKGTPLNPLVTTIMRPSRGIGSVPKKKKQKWQGGSQLPKPKDKSIASEDVYALGVEVPREYRLTYLKNYYGKAKNKKNLLKAPVTQGGTRSYYTDAYKGGRYYIEVENQRSTKKKKYEVRAHIYKIPVTN